MSSEPTPPDGAPEGRAPESEALARRPRRGLRRRIAQASPWLSWFGAIAVAVVVGQGLGPRRPIPGEVERREVTVAARLRLPHDRPVQAAAAHSPPLRLTQQARAPPVSA